MIKNQVGLEAEFFLRDAEGDLVFPGDYGFGTDDYIILGEIRATPGDTREEALANFVERWYGILFKASRLGLKVDIETGWTKLSTEQHADIMRKMGSKEVSTAQNIHGTDILELTDAIIHRGKIVGYNASIGLHVHFNSAEISEVRLARDRTYTPVYTFLSKPVVHFNQYPSMVTMGTHHLVCCPTTFGLLYFCILCILFPISENIKDHLSAGSAFYSPVIPLI